MENLKNFRLQIIISLILISLIGIFMFLSPSTFLSLRIYTAYMSTIPFFAVMALGLTFVIISGEMDLSFPAVMALSGFVFAVLFNSTENFLIAFSGAMVVSGICGLINGFIIVKIGVPSIIATIGTQFFIRGLTVLLAGGLAKNLISIRETTGHFILTGRLFDIIPMQFIWLITLSILFWAVLNVHVLGDRIRFIGDNITASATMGIPVDITRISVFIIMALCSGFSGILVCSEMANWWPTQGEGYMLVVFASVFIGGTSAFGGRGTIYGTFAGSIIIGIIEAGLISSGAQGFWTRLVYGIVVIGAVTIYALVSKPGNRS